ncbi:hypothetical protein Amet_4315 [Alkaliphilus metalliredigens QYMF]|uniref:Uncharacterized protein n=1 Tax=Alkaliphilus metalliredigens (strain QYMF) TaxID=293826 RepID=A6TW21_ALKMQ|nr:hypothetical protein [Alkaliphilus metalliredigens]ABR50389.1 hypothetical protein Amet_4315 [Alkaliphilus metalliredigens QYMF]
MATMAKKTRSNLMLFFLLLAAVLMKSPLYDKSDMDFLFFYLLLIILFTKHYSS